MQNEMGSRVTCDVKLSRIFIITSKGDYYRHHMDEYEMRMIKYFYSIKKDDEMMNINKIIKTLFFQTYFHFCYVIYFDEILCNSN